MKKTLLPICFGIIFLTAACKKNGFLSATVTNNLNKATVFADSTYTIGFLGHIYLQAGFSYNPEQFGTAGLESACDEAQGYSNDGGDTYIQFQSGTVNSTNITSNPWTTCYENIRAVNLLLKNIPGTKMDPSVKSYAVGEALFLRAWFYSILLEYYGGVPIVGDTVYNASDNVIDKRNTFGQCVNYIVSQCTKAQAYLPPQYVNNVNYYGRATAGACAGLRSRVLLYAASPLYSVTGNIAAGNAQLAPLVGYVGPDSTAYRWTLAKNSASYIINHDGGYTYVLYNSEAHTDSLSKLPGHSFKNLFTVGNNGKNQEFIFIGSLASSQFFAQLWGPPSHAGTQHAWAYEETAEAFGMNNGKAITDPTSGYNPQNPYANRDPRFDYSIMHNNELIFTAVTTADVVYEPLETYIGSPTGDGFGNGTPTGYYIFKSLDDRSTGNYELGTTQVYVYMRYAEILLNFAEAANESEGPVDSVYTVLDSIRSRGGIQPGPGKNFGLTPGMSQSQMRTVIQNERQVELAFESHRFWDVRRWKIAGQTENMLMHGMAITRQSNGSFTYQVVELGKHNFNTAMYFWPIPQSETSKSAQLLQNPGYTR